MKAFRAIISVLIVCDPNNLSREAAAMFMDGGVARSFDFFRIENTRLLKVEVDINPDDRKCDNCIGKAAGVAVAEVDIS